MFLTMWADTGKQIFGGREGVVSVYLDPDLVIHSAALRQTNTRRTTHTEHLVELYKMGAAVPFLRLWSSEYC